MMLELKNGHPRDSKISFQEEGHLYTIEGMEEHPISVTTIIHNLFPDFNEDLIITKMMNSQKWPQSKYYGQTRQEIKDLWEKNRVEASSLGTSMHYDIELYLNGEKPLHPETKEFNHFLLYWEQFQITNPGWIPFRTEWMVYDEEKKLSGSIDFVLCREDNPDEIVIMDWKRSKEIKMNNGWEKGFGPFKFMDNCNYCHYTLQLNIYKHILETHYGKTVKGLLIAVFHPNNEYYQVFKVDHLDMKSLWDDMFEWNNAHPQIITA
jgi:ATP-dependent exoDNAse (exonuclease V) beta subunit